MVARIRLLAPLQFLTRPSRSINACFLALLLIPAVFAVGALAGRSGALALNVAGTSTALILAAGFARRSWHARENVDYLMLVGVTWASLFVVRWEPAPFDLLVLLMLVFWLLRHRLALAIDSSLGTMLIVMLVMTAVQGLSFWNTPSLEMSTRYTVATLLVFAVALVSYLLATDMQVLRVMLCAYVAGAVISTAVFLVIVLSGLPYRDMLVRFGSRVTGLTKDPNVLAPYLIVAFLLLFALPDWTGWQGQGTQWRKPVWVLSLSVLALAVVLAYSRAGWVNFVIAVTTYWLLRSLDSRRTAQRVLTSVLFLMPIALFLISRVDIPEDSLLAERLRPQAYDAERFATQAKSWDAFWESPILGHGPGMSNDLLEVATHNSFLRILYENGAFSLIAFVVLLAGAIWLSLRASQAASSPLQRRIAAAICAALVGMLVSSFVIDSIHWRHLWMTVGIGWACSRWVDITKYAAHQPWAPRSTAKRSARDDQDICGRKMIEGTAS